MQITISQKVRTSPKSHYALPIHRAGRIFKTKWSNRTGLVIQSKTSFIWRVISAKGSFYWILTDKEKTTLLSNRERKKFVLILTKCQCFITKLYPWNIWCLKHILGNRQVARKDLTYLVSQHSWEPKSWENIPSFHSRTWGMFSKFRFYHCKHPGSVCAACEM